MPSVLAVVLCVLGPVDPAPRAHENNMVALFRALRMVETGSQPDPARAVGDGGRSLGPYQISRAYHIDSGVPGQWHQCRDRAYSERVMLAYWKRHCPQALRTRDFERLARVHNGGPRGAQKPATLRYWKRVEAVLNSPPLAERGERQAHRRALDPANAGIVRLAAR